MEGGAIAAAAALGVQDQGQQQQQKVVTVEKLNQAVQQQLNLESVKTRAIGLFKAISRILEDLDVMARTNSIPKWQDVLGQFSMVNLELSYIVEDIKKVSKAFVVHPKNVNAENATNSRTGGRSFEFGRTHVVRPKGKHQATIVWLHGLGANGSRQVNDCMRR